MVDCIGTDTQVDDDPALFELIASNLFSHGYTVHRNALPLILGNSLWDQSHETPAAEFQPASIGRNNSRALDVSVRNDQIAWIDRTTVTGCSWVAWASSLRLFLNRRLFLGLDSFESHHAIYPPGGFYRRHQDAFRGDENRLLSLVIFLNRDWVPADAGQLVLFTGDYATDRLVITPQFGTLVVFLSEEIEHEVLETTRDRHSVAGWFRTRSSQID